MPRPVVPIDMDHARRLRSEGKTNQEIASALGVNVLTLGARLRAERVPPPAKRRPMPGLDCDAIARAYQGGDSVLAIAERLGISRGPVARALRAHGILLRDGAEAGRLRMAREGEDGRRRLMQAAHAAIRGRKQNATTKVQRAQRRTTTAGIGEAELLQALRRAGIEAEGQRPVGHYNVDVAFNAVAVELLRLPTAFLRRADLPDRRKCLRDAGLCTVLVLFRHLPDLLAHLDDVVSFLQRADRDPATHGQDWMVRCAREHAPRRGADGRYGAAVPAPVRSFHTIREWH